MTARNKSAWSVLQLWNYPSVFPLSCMTMKRQNVNTLFSLQIFKKAVTKGEVLGEGKGTQRGELAKRFAYRFSLMLHLNYRRASHANPIGRLCQEIHNHGAILITPVGFAPYLICTRHWRSLPALCFSPQPCVSAVIKSKRWQQHIH